MRTEPPSFVIPSRISSHAELATIACAPFSYGKAHEVRQRHQVQQEIRGSFARDDKKGRVVEGRGPLSRDRAIVGEAGTAPFLCEIKKVTASRDDKGKVNGS
jgi:hypothetical protein